MGFFRPYDSTGEPCFFEVYGSSARLAFSRYFVVAHVDGFLYVLDKYFCISRLVPSRTKRICNSLARRSCSLAGSGQPTRGVDRSEAVRIGEQNDGRPLVIEQQPIGVCSHQPSTEEDHLEGSQLLVPVRIADVLSALFRTDKPVFSQLLTGNNQYDQRQLQGLRQKSLLLSNRHDGCLYLFLKKFLVRVSLRGTVTVVGDLLELALAAASRLRVGSSLGSTSGGTTTSASSSHLLREDGGSGRQGDSSSVRRICSARQFFREMGHAEDIPVDGSLGSSGECVANAAKCESAAQEEHELEPPGTDDASAQVWEYLKSMSDLHSPSEQYPDSSWATGRLQEFVACRGENWEVNNCCIDGEGRCFFTMARSKFLSPVEERGMIFCLDTKGPVARAVVLRFGRGITQSAVLSLSLFAHPDSGCILLVAKSAAEVRNCLLGPVISPRLSVATDCHPPQENGVTTAFCGTLRGPGVGARMNTTNSAYAVGGEDTLAAVPGLSDMQDSEGPSAVEATVTGQGIQGEGSGQTRRAPTMSNPGGNIHPHIDPTGSRDQPRNAHHEWQQASEAEREAASAEELSTWWFCPCDDEPSFFFPVAQWFDDAAIHDAAQSLCRQLRGSASSSVCRAYFEDNGGTALREAKAAAAAVRKAELTMTATMHANGLRDSGLGVKHPLASSVASAERESFKAERAMRTAVYKAMKEASIAASRAERAEKSGYILWQPGVKVRRPKTGEEAISFGSAILFRARITCRREPVTGRITGPPRPPQPPRSSDLITGELVAVISQDARHLEVRDALPSPLGLIVVPAEAANRIVKQQPDGTSGRISSRSNVSLTSFLASFIAGGPSAASERDDLSGVTTPPGQGNVEDFRPFASDSHQGEPPVAGGMTSLGANTNAAQDSIIRRAVPAVNIVFLVDTLRMCRLAEARLAHGSRGHNGLQQKSDQRLLGLADAAISPTCEQPTCASSHGWKNNGTKTQNEPAVVGALPTSGTVTQPDSDANGGSSCSCKQAGPCLGDPPTSVLHSHFADVTLLCADGVEVSSHRALLAARCSFFEAKLTRPHWEARDADKVVIDLRGFAGSVVQATVHFFETGYFVIPASCCCPHCCVEQQRDHYEHCQTPQQRGLPPYESHCCCKVDWVLQAYTFAAYCLLEDLKIELLAVLARLTSQRTCLYVLTHPAVRNQRQILQLAAHQLVYHMPTPALLLEVERSREWVLSPTDNSVLKAKETSPLGGSRVQQQKRREPLLTQLLSEGVYDVVVKALSAWVLDTHENIVLLSKLLFLGNCDTPSPCLRPRHLLVLLALRLLQESVTAPLSTMSIYREPSNSPHDLSTIYRTFISDESHCAPESSMVPPWGQLPEKTSLVVPLRDSHDAVRYFLFRDVVLLWANILGVSEEDAKVMAQGVEYSFLP
ncbi:hypothetical protein, conserved [Eimeria brunetti]|uniref:BTB domain-containing protein n=1 Tax=Eimeria brunetti TaxID=51314 RepID=U6LMC4_9EIME|nr:hypothetical protein, conserved [Eimeria brunetti]